jgi:hypothetical protein
MLSPFFQPLGFPVEQPKHYQHADTKPEIWPEPRSKLRTYYQNRMNTKPTVVSQVESIKKETQ